jgi:hypothetical protein
MALIQVHCCRKGALLEGFQMEMVVLDDKGHHGKASSQRDNSIPIIIRSACNVIVKLTCDQPFPNILIIDERV